MKDVFIAIGIFTVLGLTFYIGALVGVSIGCSSGIYESARLETLEGGYSRTIYDQRSLLQKRCLNENGSHKRLR